MLEDTRDSHKAHALLGGRGYTNSRGQSNRSWDWGGGVMHSSAQQRPQLTLLGNSKTTGFTQVLKKNELLER